MLTDKDLQAAVAADVITADQAKALRHFARNEDIIADPVDPGEERFTFYRGFNDIFIAIGTALLMGGVLVLMNNIPNWVVGAAITLAVFWGLAEYITGRLRLVLSSIFLAIGISGLAAVLLAFAAGAVAQFGDVKVTMIWVPLGALIGAVLFYARFRLPFALLLIAGFLTGTILVLGYQFYPAQIATWRDGVIFLCGLASFATAMTFDLKDPMRTSRFADCAFWLHLIAAPMIVHPLISWVAPKFFDLTGTAALMIMVITGIIAIVALIIDRRAILVSSLIYAGSALGYAFRQTEIPDTTVLMFTLGVLGAAVIILGVGWKPLRRALLVLAPSSLALNRP